MSGVWGCSWGLPVRFLEHPKPGVLSLSSRGMWSSRILCWGRRPVHRRVFSHIIGLQAH